MAFFLLNSCAFSRQEEQALNPVFTNYTAPLADAGALNRTIYARGDYAYEPFEYIDKNGQNSGFNIELLERIAQIMGLDIRIELGPWEEVRTQLESGKIDLLPGMYKTMERDKLVDFSIPHFISSYGIFSKHDYDIETLEDLRGKRIAVQLDDVGYDYLVEQGFSDNLVLTRNWEDIFTAVLDEKADLAVASLVQATRLFSDRDFHSLYRIGPIILQEKYCMAVKEGDAELLAALNEGLNILKSSGEYDRIYEKWFGVYEDAQIRSQRIIHNMRIALLLSMGIIALILLWSLLLRSQVRAKTKTIRQELMLKETAQQELQQALQQAKDLKDRAEEADRKKSVFLASVSHELRTPLHGVISTSRLLADTTLQEEQRVYLGLLQDAAAQLERLITDLLDLTRVSTGRLSFNPGDFQLKNIKDWAEQTLRQTAEEKGLDFICTIENPELYIRADKSRLTQLLINLVHNAIKYTEQGMVSIRIYHADKILHVAVSDTGVGIPENERKNIFKTFYQIKQDRVDGSQGGLGLGLPIVHMIAKAMGGSIRHEHNKPRGSTFIMEIPVQTASESSSLEKDSNRDDLEQQIDRIKKRNIAALVVEDQAVNALYIQRLFQNNGSTAEHAGSGETALKKIQDKTYDLILMDMGLPGIDGLETTRRIRDYEQENGARRTAIIALTANAFRHDQEACLEAGMDGFIPKPFGERAFWLEIDRVLHPDK